MKKWMIIVFFCTMYACTEKFPDGENQYKHFSPDGIPFTIADSAWNFDRLGSQRALVAVEQSDASHTVQVTLPWRRADLRPETKKIVIMDSKTGQEIKNVSILDFSSERGVIVFQPQTIPGLYEIYYLSANFKKGYGDARWGKPNHYLPPEYAAEPVWEKTVKENSAAIPAARLIRFEARTKFDFFTPMGLIATEKEKQDLKQNKTGDFLLFPEDRAYPIRLTTLPARWAKTGASNQLKGFAAPNEYYTWQIGVWATDKPLNDVRLIFSDFKHSSGSVIAKEDITCFNQGGTNWDGQPVAFQVCVPYDQVQAMWCGLQIPETIRGGK
jgi:hypothetical protein